MIKHLLRSAVGVSALLSGLAGAHAGTAGTFNVAPAQGTGLVPYFAFLNGSTVTPGHVPVNSSNVELFGTTTPGVVRTNDTLNAAATITAADSGSTTATGQSGVSVVTGTATAASVSSYAVNGQAEADFTITGAFVGTLQFEGSADGGTTWTPRSAHVMGTKYRVTQATAPGAFHINASGLTNIRVRAVALTSGTPGIRVNTTAGTGSIYVQNPIELVDNTTGLSPAVKAGGTSSTSDNAMTVQDPTVVAAINQTAVPGPVSPNLMLPSSSSGTNATFFAGTAGKKVLGGYGCNLATSIRHIKFIDKGSTPVPGTDTVVMTIPILPGCGAIDVPPGGLPFVNGIAIALTTGAALNDTGPVGAAEIQGLNLFHN